MLAVLKAGGCYVPLDPGFPADKCAGGLAACSLPCEELPSLPRAAGTAAADTSAAGRGPRGDAELASPSQAVAALLPALPASRSHTRQLPYCALLLQASYLHPGLRGGSSGH